MTHLAPVILSIGASFISHSAALFNRRRRGADIADVGCYPIEVPNLLPQWVDVTRLLFAVGLTVLAFTLCATAFTLRGNRIIAAFLAAGAWLFGAFGLAVWFLQR